MAKQEDRDMVLLHLLNDASAPLKSRELTERMNAYGHDVSERSVRLYLNQLEDRGLVQALGRRGRLITESGLEAIRTAQVLQRVGFLSAKIDRMTYRMSFDLQRRAGKVVINTSVVRPQHLLEFVKPVCEVFAQGYAMGDRLGLIPAGKTAGDTVIPEGMVGFCTVCSITLNGVLLKHGIPTRSRFGGLLQVKNGDGVRFAELIEYDGTSIDPLEVFIRSGMTDYSGAIRDGNGMIGASFRELPAESRDLVLNLSERLDEIGLGALMSVGYPAQPLMDIPVSEGRIGAIVIGGLNPISILEENGRRIESRALAGLMEYNELFHYSELETRLRGMVG